MGYNVTIVVHSDSLGTIAQDPEFGKNLVEAIGQLNVSEPGKVIDVPCLNHCNAAEVIEQHHADQTVVVAVGGNTGTVLGTHYGWQSQTDEERIEILRSVADQMGFHLRRKS